MPTTERQFRVHARHIDGHHARTLSEQSFEAAAIAYLEDLHPPGEESEISVIVHEVETGHEHCFRIDLGDRPDGGLWLTPERITPPGVESAPRP